MCFSLSLPMIQMFAGFVTEYTIQYFNISCKIPQFNMKPGGKYSSQELVSDFPVFILNHKNHKFFLLFFLFLPHPAEVGGRSKLCGCWAAS